MPALLKKGEKQLEFEQENESRFVTKMRYIIECVNGKLKTEIFECFSSVRFNKEIPYVMEDFKIACDAFYSRIYYDRGN